MHSRPIQGDTTPDEHAVLRYCAPSTLSNGAPDVPSFARKPAHSYLSVNDADLASGATSRERASHSRLIMEPWLTMRPSGMLAAAPVKSIHAIEAAPSLRVTYEPIAADDRKPANPFHCGIHGVPTEDDMKRGQTSVLIALVGTVTESWLVKDL
jgi:hypothetical protein